VLSFGDKPHCFGVVAVKVPVLMQEVQLGVPEIDSQTLQPIISAEHYLTKFEPFM